MEVRFGDVKIDNKQYQASSLKGSFRPRWTATSGELYTLIIWDEDAASSPYLHYLSVNIKNRITSGDVIMSYVPPTPPPGDKPHRYHVSLYRQKRPIQMFDIYGRGGYDITQFIRDNNLDKISDITFTAVDDRKPNVELSPAGRLSSLSDTRSGFSSSPRRRSRSPQGRASSPQRDSSSRQSSSQLDSSQRRSPSPPGRSPSQRDSSQRRSPSPAGRSSFQPDSSRNQSFQADSSRKGSPSPPGRSSFQPDSSRKRSPSPPGRSSFQPDNSRRRSPSPPGRSSFQPDRSSSPQGRSSSPQGRSFARHDRSLVRQDRSPSPQGRYGRENSELSGMNDKRSRSPRREKSTPASREKYFIEGTKLSEREQAYCMCLLDVKGNVNPYPICTASVGEQSRDCADNYNYSELSIAQLRAFAKYHKLGGNNRSSIIRNIENKFKR